MEINEIIPIINLPYEGHFVTKIKKKKTFVRSLIKFLHNVQRIFIYNILNVCMRGVGIQLTTEHFNVYP